MTQLLTEEHSAWLLSILDGLLCLGSMAQDFCTFFFFPLLEDRCPTDESLTKFMALSGAGDPSQKSAVILANHGRSP